MRLKCLGYKKAGKDSSLLPCPLILYAPILRSNANTRTGQGR